MASSLPRTPTSSAQTRAPNRRLWPRILAAVAVVAPLVIFGAYRFRSSPSTGAAPADGIALEDDAPTSAENRAERSRSRRHVAPAAVEPEPIEVPPPPPPEMSAQEHRDKSVAEIRASGPDRRNLLEAAQRVAQGWSAKLSRMGVRVEVGRFECHKKGCFVAMVHDSDADLDRGMAVITRTGEFHGWHSGKMRSGPIARDNGKVEVTWFLFPPKDGQEALASTLPEDRLEELVAAAAP
jgi:hypothetical protein